MNYWTDELPQLHHATPRDALVSHCQDVESARSALVATFGLGVLLCGQEMRRRPMDLHCVPPLRASHLLQDVSGRAFSAKLRSGARLLYVPVPKVASYMLRIVLGQKACYTAEADLPTIPPEVQAWGDQSKSAVLLDALSAANRAVLSFVRDPVERFASAFFEMETYEEQGAIRQWGRMVLSRLGMPTRPPNQSTALGWQQRLHSTVHALACLGNWQPHYTPQATFVPEGASTMLVADLSVLGSISTALAPELVRSACARKFEEMRHESRIVHERSHMRAHELLSELHGEEQIIWCLYYLPDYLRFEWYTPPGWCNATYVAHGFAHLTTQRRSQRPFVVDWSLLGRQLNMSAAQLQGSERWRGLAV